MHPANPRRDLRALFAAAALVVAGGVIPVQPAIAGPIGRPLAVPPRPGTVTPRGPASRIGHDGHAASRLQSMAFYEGVNENTDLPPAFMAANYDWTEQGMGAQYADAYHNAGGKHAMQYTDSNGRNCSSNQPGSCHDALTLLNNLPEEAWLHEASQPAVRVFQNGQQRNNPLDPVFQAAWTQQIDALMNPSAGGSLAYTAAEGGSVELDTLNWETIPTFTQEGGPEHEITDGTHVIAAEAAAVALTPTNAVGNGVDYDYPLSGAYDTFMNAAGLTLIGMFNENAFATNYGSGYMTNAYPISNAWANQQDGILDVVARHKYDFVWMKGSASPAHRLYGLASAWLTLHGNRTVIWEEFCAPDKTPGGLCNSTWDDPAIVPKRPLTSATTNVNVLQNGALFVREFAACYQSGQPIGPCAAVVNPGTASASWPALNQQYTRTIALPTASLYGGGKVGWTTGLPSSVAAASAWIVAGSP